MRTIAPQIIGLLVAAMLTGEAGAVGHAPAAALRAAGAAGAAPTMAVSLRPLLSADAVLQQLTWRGYTDFSEPRLVGRTYRVAATTTRGTRIGVVVDAYSGVVLHQPKTDGRHGPQEFPPSGGR